MLRLSASAPTSASETFDPTAAMAHAPDRPRPHPPRRRNVNARFRRLRRPRRVCAEARTRRSVNSPFVAILGRSTPCARRSFVGMVTSDVTADFAGFSVGFCFDEAPQGQADGASGAGDGLPRCRLGLGRARGHRPTSRGPHPVEAGEGGVRRRDRPAAGAARSAGLSRAVPDRRAAPGGGDRRHRDGLCLLGRRLLDRPEGAGDRGPSGDLRHDPAPADDHALVRLGFRQGHGLS